MLHLAQALPSFQPALFNSFDRLSPSGTRATADLTPVRNAPATAPTTGIANADARAQRAAGNILLFIENQLSRDVAAGDSVEQLQGRLNSGLEGFLQGFNEARDELKQRGLLSPELDTELQQTYSRVLQGLSNIAAELGLDPSEIAKAKQSQSQDEVMAPKQPQALTWVPVAAQGVVQESRSFSFTLQTQDGDAVSITASSQYKAKGSVSFGEQSNFSGKFSQQQQFALSIEGNLDEQELSAINDLLSQVNDLAAQFYQGDLTAAFDAALALDYNAEEIAGFALDLRHSIVQKVRTTYAQPQSETSPLHERLAPLSTMADLVQSALESARTFAEPLALLESLLQDATLLNQDEIAPKLESKANYHELFNDVNREMLQQLA